MDAGETDGPVEIPWIDRSGPTDGTYETRHDWDDGELPSVAVVEAVSFVTGTDPVELPELYGTLNPDALDALFTGRGHRPDSSRSHEDEGHSPGLSFRYAGCDVFLDRAGYLSVTPAE